MTRATSIEYNRGMENKAYSEIAMDLSDGLFAWHLFGVLNACQGLQCPDLQKVALEYLEWMHASELALIKLKEFSQKTLDPTTSS